MKKFLAIGDLDRVVKFVHDLNEMAHKHNVGLSSMEDIYLTMDGEELPFVLDASGTDYGDPLQVAVPL